MKTQAVPLAAASNVVVVEDDASMRQAIERILRLAGYRISMFCSAEALMDRGAPADASCLVLDVHLPGLTGFELCERLQRWGSRVPVIFITAYDDPTARTDAKVAGAVDYLSKPFSGHALIAAVGRAITA